MKILQFYVLRELAAPFVVSSAFFASALLVVRLFEMSKMLLSAGLGLGVLGELMIIVVGTVVTLTVPMALLLGTLIGVARLAGENEILAMRVGGARLTSVFMPFYAVALLISVGLSAVSHLVIPHLYDRINSMRVEARTAILSNLQPGRTYDGIDIEGGEMSLSFNERDRSAEGLPGQLRMKGVNLHMRMPAGVDLTPAPPAAVGAAVDVIADAVPAAPTPDPTPDPAPVVGEEAPEQGPGPQFLVFAESGELDVEVERDKMVLRLFNGTLLPASTKVTKQSTVIGFAEMEQEFDAQTGKAIDRRSRMREAHAAELWHLVSVKPVKPLIREDQDGRRIDRTWRDYFAARNEFLQRFTLPLAALAFSIVAVPLAIELRPRAKGFAFLIALALMVFYYVLLTVANSIGSSGSFGHDAVGWTVVAAAFLMPNVVLAGVGIVLMRRMLSR